MPTFCPEGFKNLVKQQKQERKDFFFIVCLDNSTTVALSNELDGIIYVALVYFS